MGSPFNWFATNLPNNTQTFNRDVGGGRARYDAGSGRNRSLALKLTGPRYVVQRTDNPDLDAYSPTVSRNYHRVPRHST
jgi:hypothetical protein